MILLEFHNKIIEDTLLEKFGIQDGKYDAVEMIIADFDGVTFHLFTEGENKQIFKVSMSMKGYADLKKFGVDDIMNKTYGNHLASTESGYDVTVQVDCSSPGDGPKIARDMALLKRHALAAPFYKVFADIEAKKPAAPLIEIRYRDDETLYLKPEADRVIVIFSVSFKDADDVIFAKVFLNEYQDARKTMSNAPSVLFSQKEPPLELKGVRNLKVGEGQSFVSFVLFASHISGNKKEKKYRYYSNIQKLSSLSH